ncbi:hypothetical protein PV327_011200 [Microctonus hyperodae]|uniref:PDZ domain-containing protein n=1 Tax=Microctonus hyperodae TaxID=165561 RepID=A0AA39FKY0_MICHY|nr:hypothetical protein PV327_011200 [Microctonus hyperodae]
MGNRQWDPMSTVYKCSYPYLQPHLQKIKKKHGHLGGQVILIEITKDGRDVGLALAGHKDRMRMGVYICGINPKGAAHKAGIIQEGDEILEAQNVIVLQQPPVFLNDY